CSSTFSESWVVAGTSAFASYCAKQRARHIHGTSHNETLSSKAADDGPLDEWVAHRGSSDGVPRHQHGRCLLLSVETTPRRFANRDCGDSAASLNAGGANRGVLPRTSSAHRDQKTESDRGSGHDCALRVAALH